MAKKAKKEYPFTVVYVYAPELYKNDYMRGEAIPNVKIGETKSEAGDYKTCMDAAMKRINQQSTSFKEYMYLLLWFVFPYKEKTDDAIRTILTEDIYNLTSSKKIDTVTKKQAVNDRRTKIGLEFAYNISMSLVNTAIAVYKLKSKMEELINDRTIDPAFKKRCKQMINELISNLGDIVNESGQNEKCLPVAEQKKIYMIKGAEEMEPQL